MLNQNEEEAVRRLVKDSTPMKVANPDQNYLGQTTEGQHISQLMRNVSAPVVVAGQPLPPTDNRPLIKSLGEDPELLAKTAHVRHKGERLIQLMARTGIGLDQLRNLSRQEIARFVEVAGRQEQPQVPVELTEGPKPRPSRFLLEV